MAISGSFNSFFFPASWQVRPSSCRIGIEPKKTMKAVLYILPALMLLGCTRNQESSDTGKPVVFVSILPLRGLAKAVAGDRIEIRTLVGEGQSPHTYEPTARQLAQLGDANALLCIGMPFEKRLLEKIVPLYPNVSIVKTQQGIEPRILPHESHGKSCGHGKRDPHLWLSPVNAATLAQNICQVLQRIDPAGTPLFQENHKQLDARLTRLDAELHETLSSAKGNRFYVFHPSFGYFADAYGLTQISIELDGKAPAPRQLAALVDQAQADGIKVVFVQKQFPANSARAIAEAIGGKVLPLDPLAEDSLANLRSMANAIAQSLEK